MRLIDKDRLLEDMNVIKRGFDGQDDFNLSKCALVYAAHQCIESVKQQPTVEENKWISVDDELPKGYLEIWVTIRYDKNEPCKTMEAYSSNDKFYCDKECYYEVIGEVLAWQEKYEPKPYKPKGSE